MREHPEESTTIRGKSKSCRLDKVQSKKLIQQLLLFLAITLFISPTDLFAESAPAESEQISEEEVSCRGNESEQEKPEAQTVLETFPSSVIAGCVNAVTGDYFESTIDLCSPAPAPIYVQRSWSSSDKKWHFGHRPLLEVGMSESENHFVAAYRNDQGGGQRYRAAENSSAITNYGKGKILRTRASDLEKGYINCAEGEISAETHIKNSSIVFGRRKGKKRFIFKHGSKMERVLSRFDNKGEKEGVLFGKFRLEEELHPNGNRLAYSYRSKQELSNIRSYNALNQLMGTVQIINEKQHHLETWRNHFSHVHYRLNNKQLFSATPSHAIPVRYAYDERKRIIRKFFPDGRALFIDYDDGKVKSLSVAEAGKKEPVITHTFSYKKSASSGHKCTATEVCTAEGERRVYRSKEKKLSSIEYYQDERLLANELYSWSRGGDLLSRKLMEGDQTHFIKTLEYNHDGSLSKETVAGNLTGRGWSEHTKTFRHDAKKRLPVEENDGRMWRRFSYQSEKNQLTARFTGAHNNILKREFFSYDVNGTVVSEIIDDGTCEDFDNLEGVTERHYKKITPTSSAPYGLPEKVEEFYLDTATQQYQLLRTTIYRYENTPKPIEEKVYGAQGELLHAIARRYDHLGNITEQRDGSSHAIEYQYDKNGNKTREIHPHLTKTFLYDYGNRLVKEEEQWPNGQIVTTSHRYSSNGRKVATIDPYGHETTFSYDAMGRLIKTVSPPVTTPDGSTIPVVHRCEKDMVGNKVKEWDALGHCTETRYTTYGHPYHITYPDGSAETKEYTPDGLLIKERAKNGLETVYTHDAWGRVIQKEIFSPEGVLLKCSHSSYNTFHLLSEVDEAGVETHYRYNGAGELIRVERAGKIKEYLYDAAGREIATTEWIESQSARITKKVYNLLDQVTQTSVEDLAGNVLKKEEYAYDSAGNRTHVTIWSEEGAATTVTTYAPNGKPSQVIDPLGNVTRYSYEYSSLLKTVQIDPLGEQQIEWIDCHGQTVMKQLLNPLGKLIQQQRDYYDPCSHLIASHATLFEGTDRGETVMTEWQYDCMGNAIACQEGAGTSDEKVTRHTFNLFGQKESTTLPNRVEVINRYDELGRLHSMHSSDDTIHYVYTYDIQDRPICVEDRCRHTQNRRSYDPHGRLASETLDNGLQLDYQYDGLDRTTEVHFPDGSAVHYHYTPSHLERVDRIINGEVAYSHRYEAFDLSGLPTRHRLAGDAGELHFKRDALRRPLHLHNQHRSEKLEYDATGNLTTREITDPLGHEEIRYTYDDLYQLTSESGLKSHLYKHDSLRNRRQKDEEVYNVNVLNQLTNASGQDYIYDLNGNLIRVGNSIFEYDALSRLTKVITPEAKTTYTYDSFHRRMTKSTSGRQENYLYQDQCEVGAWTNGKPSQLRILGQGYGQEIGAAIAVEIGGKPYVPLHDIAGNVALLVDLSGKPIQTYRYTAFGELLASEGTIDNPWRFSSKRFDEESGYYYFGRRYYSPEVGRWTTPDPAGFVDGLNLYAFVHNSPLIQVDPDGQLAFLIPIALNIAIGCAIDCALPAVVAGIEYYSGSVTAAAFAAGTLKGYNGDYSSSFGGGNALSWVERGGMALGTLASLNPRNLGKKAIKQVATGEAASVTLNKVANSWSKGAARCCAGKTAQASAKKVATTTSEQTIEIATKKVIAQSAKKSKIENKIIESVNRKLVTGQNNPISVLGFTQHGVNQAINRSVSPKNIVEALKKPLQTKPIKYDHFGRASQRYIGRYAEVVINPHTKKILSVNPTSSIKAEKLIKGISK